jgi:hypothetical protein
MMKIRNEESHPNLPKRASGDHLNKNKTDITMVLDRSGSMKMMSNPAIIAFNAFVSEQQQVDEEACLSLVQFNQNIERTFHTLSLNEVVELDHDTYIPRGTTALLDAIGETISNNHERLADETETQVVIVVITDGLENSSTRFKRDQIKDLINECEADRGWRFIFLAADLTSVEAGQELGIKQERAFVMGRSGEDYDRSVKMVSKKMAYMRQMKDPAHLDFTEEERRKHDSDSSRRPPGD